MKNILIILLLLMPFELSAQTDREILIEIAKQQVETNKQVAELAKQQVELAKQQAITATKLDSFEKSTEKRLDTQNTFMIVIMSLVGVLIAAILSFIGFILWDRRAALKPFEIKVVELEKEVKELKEKELKHQEKELKSENILKKIVEKFPDLAGLV